MMDFGFLSWEFLAWVAIGFLAQIADGAIGMGFGVLTTVLLLSIGVSPAAASASVHVAKVVTGAASGLSHLRIGNVDWALARPLLIAGFIGALFGALVLVEADADWIRPVVAVYLLLMGLMILFRVAARAGASAGYRKLLPLGFIGGLLDVIGGGGWGPIVTSRLIATGTAPRLAVGSANLAEIGVAVAATVAFAGMMGLGFWRTILALCIGGVVAAPLAALASHRLNARLLRLIVGVAVVATSIYTLVRSLMALGFL